MSTVCRSIQATLGQPAEGGRMRKLIDLTGQRFGMLVVVVRAEDYRGKRRWTCRCDCGGERIVREDHLKSGLGKACRCDYSSGKMVECAHLECNKLFKQTMAMVRKGRGRFCSKRCARDEEMLERHGTLSRANPDIIYHKVCVECGARFTSSKHHTRFCSKDCGWRRHGRLQYRREVIALRPPIDCVVCGVSFYAFGSTGETCSDGCQHQRERDLKRAGKAKRRARLRNVHTEHVSPLYIFNRDGWRCHICGHKTDKRLIGKAKAKAPTLDHLIPIACGGVHAKHNIATAHFLCNSRKCMEKVGDQLLLFG